MYRLGVAAIFFIVTYLFCHPADAQPPPDDEVCHPRNVWIEHQADLTDCQVGQDRLHGRLSECRDSIEPLQVRIEKLAADLSETRTRHIHEKNKLRTKLDTHVPVLRVVLYVGGAAILGGAIGYGAAQMDL